MVVPLVMNMPQISSHILQFAGKILPYIFKVRAVRGIFVVFSFVFFALFSIHAFPICLHFDAEVR